MFADADALFDSMDVLLEAPGDVDRLETCMDVVRIANSSDVTDVGECVVGMNKRADEFDASISSMLSNMRLYSRGAEPL
jgi:hypothetical protein